MKDKKSVIGKMIETGIIPVYNHKELAVCIEVLKACYEAGIFVFEFTARGESASKVFIELKKYRDLNFPNLILGVGTVLDKEAAQYFIGEGADFIVSPILDIETATVCLKENVTWIPQILSQ